MYLKDRRKEYNWPDDIPFCSLSEPLKDRNSGEQIGINCNQIQNTSQLDFVYVHKTVHIKVCSILKLIVQ